MSKIKDLSIEGENALIPFLPSSAWEISAYATATQQSAITFNWIQAFFDAETTPAPVLAIYSGKNDADGEPILSPVYFSYSGERVFFKGCLILESGVDRFGNTVTSTTIGSLDKIIAYGGNS